MSVGFNAETDRLRHNANFPSVNNVTGRCFGRLRVDRNDFNTFIAMVNTATTDYQIIQTDTSGTDLYLYDSQPGTGGAGLTQIGPVTLTVGDWYYMAYSSNGTTLTLHVRNITSGAAMTTLTDTAQGSRTIEFLEVGGHDVAIFEFLDGSICGVAYWDAVLTTAEVLLDSYSIVPRRTANLNRFYPMMNTSDKLVDYSGNGRDLVEASTGPWTTESNPPVPFRGHKPQPLIVLESTAHVVNLPYRFRYP